ncbi:Cyclic di-GMP phosphodiesterase response regulator RpfG [Rosistilla carotiformis]|uniref:Cyclic di-GMP phosphodiesterase response regulator RpfG n=1 Tax=Rosistilla carotiformis TaxID=2528017 RepID=A0A518JVB6_9BACT|nr:HD domain-containing phosphohydrolase [Rosistilla carotiformis]QDV69492.1 Cyclic di-GMP phosphodiesterase response regulator RpfG [Rosistilla carotiformis]
MSTATLSPQRPTAAPALNPTNAGRPTGNPGANAQARSPRIMIVDDVEVNILTVQGYLKKVGYRDFVTTSNPHDALKLIHEANPDVLLLDIQMPEISGLDILRVMGADPVLQHLPVLVLTADQDPVTKQRALDLGANDFLQKPIDPHDLVPRVRNALVLKAHHDQLSRQATWLEQQVKARTAALLASQQQLILSLARAAEHRDNDTANHVIRVGRYAGVIARKLGYLNKRIPMLELAAQLHDVGKIGIPDAILLKPGALEPDEYELMKNHCTFGRKIIAPISGKDLEVLRTHATLGNQILKDPCSPLLKLAAKIAQCHHERWDGKGYPLGLAGEDIPIEARIVSIADVYDALSSKRPYKEPFPRQKCFDIIREGRGTQFDPQLVDAFFSCSEEIIQIQLELMDD